MNTFLPLPDLQLSVETLDARRLGKQRVEGKQILTILLNERRGIVTEQGWANHPATRQWEGYEYALFKYIRYCCRRWRSLGYVDNIEAQLQPVVESADLEDSGLPDFIGNRDFHRAHRSKLMFKGRKDVLAYGIKRLIIDTNDRQSNGRLQCVEGWLHCSGYATMNALKLPQVELIESHLNYMLGTGRIIPINHYASYQWDVNDRDELEYIWPSQLTTA